MINLEPSESINPHIKLRIHCPQEIELLEGIGGVQLSAVINTIEKACYEQEMETLRSLLSIEEIELLKERMSLEASDWRRHISTLKITKASQGSIILEGVIAATSTWLLINTVGESIKEAWKESGLHKKLKELLLYGRNNNVEKIATNIENSLDSPYMTHRKIVRKEVTILQNDNRFSINIEIEVADEFMKRSKAPAEITELAKILINKHHESESDNSDRTLDM